MEGRRVIDLVAAQQEGSGGHNMVGDGGDGGTEDDSVFMVNETQWSLRGAALQSSVRYPYSCANLTTRLTN